MLLKSKTPDPRRANIAALAAVVLPLFAVLNGTVALAADPDPARAARVKALTADEASLRLAIASIQTADAALEAVAKKTAEADKPLLEAALEARKKALEAGNAYLASLVPETDPVEIEARGDAWVRAQNALELANLALAYANERTRMAIARGAEQAAAAAKMPDVVRRDNERLTARKALLEANVQLRIAERRRRAAGLAFEEALRNP
jgi:hypothetical protein